MFLNFFERRRIKKAVESLLGSGDAERLHQARGAPLFGRLTEKAIEFAYVTIAADDVANFAGRIAIVTDIAIKCGAVVCGNVAVIEIAFGIVGPVPSGARHRLVDTVHSGLSESAAIVHGSITATVGPFGSHDRICYGFWWPGAADALRRLLALSPGEVLEI